VVLDARLHRPIVLGSFSCQWAAVVALVRLRVPDFVNPEGDLPEDLEEERRMPERLHAARHGDALQRSSRADQTLRALGFDVGAP
jgi:hypothetical protein